MMTLMRLWGWHALLLLCTLSQLLHSGHAQLRVVANFNQRGVSGSVEFSQQSPESSTTITLNLAGLSNFGPFPWHVHEYPFPYDGQANPCREEVTGGHFDPLGAFTGDDYAENCRSNRSLCEVGDISGRFGSFDPSSPISPLMDPFISLYGIYSIIGHSIVFHFSDTTRFVCANIEYPSDQSSSGETNWLYVPFRDRFSGNIYFRQHTNASTASVYTNLQGQSSSENSDDHNWHVHDVPLNTTGECASAGPHYNPRGVNITSPQYPIICNPQNQSNCEIGDLSSKGGRYNVNSGGIAHFYTDTDLPLSGEPFSIDGRSVVIHAANAGGPRIACANISRFLPLQAEAVFTAVEGETPVSGSITFTQNSPFDLTTVSVNLMGLNSMAGGYHVHVNPIGPPDVGFPARCSGTYAGGHWNPLVVDYNTVPPVTSEQYEIGDLSGKFGNLASRNDIDETYSDPNIPLFGPFGIIGRSIVVHFDDESGTRWTCANIVHTQPVVEVTFSFDNDDVVGHVTFSQLAEDPNSATTIVVELEVRVDLDPPLPITSVPVVVSSTPPVLSSTPVIDPVVSTSNVVFSTPELPSSSPLFSSPVPTSTSQVVVSSSQPPVTNATSTSLIPTPSPSFTAVVKDSTSVVPSPTSSPLQVLSPSSTPSTPPQPSPIVSMELLAPSDFFSPPDSMDPNFLLPFSTPSPETTPPPTQASPGRRRRSSLNEHRARRQVGSDPTVTFSWSLRSGQVTDPASCGDLPILGGVSPDTCSQENPLSCSAGDLTSKHGTLSFPPNRGLLRVVLTDPNLPLSGPNSVFTDNPSSSGILLIEPVPGATQSTVSLCNPAPQVQVPPPPPATPPTPPTTPPPATPQTTASSTGAVPSTGGNTLGAIVGGIIAAIVAVVVVIFVVLLVVCVMKKRGHSKYELDKTTQMEMGSGTPSKPILGVANYKVLHHYEPQNKDDLALNPGEWVTLEETPYGGGWWKGTIDDRGPGWFPKTYVTYIDREAEKKKKQDESFTLAAAAIMDASTSFGPSVATRRNTEVPRTATKKKGKSAKRTHTFSKKEIDSTPKMVTKFDKPYLERDNVMVIENSTRDSGSQSGGSRPDTPASYKHSEIIANAQAMDSGGSQDDDFVPNLSELLGGEDLLPHADKHLAKYDFVGSTDIELEFKKGGLIQVIEKADNGWWQGVHQGQVGWFPESYVDLTPLKMAPLSAVLEVRDEGARERAESASSAADVEKPKNMDEMMGAAGGDLEALEYHAIHSYQSGTEGDLEFSEGDTVLVYWGQDNGWWYGAFGGKQGWFPESYVEPIIDTSLLEATPAVEPAGEQIKEAPVISDQSVVKDGGEADVGSVERAPSSVSQDSGVGQEEVKDEGKPEASSLGLHSELASILSARKEPEKVKLVLPSDSKEKEPEPESKKGPEAKDESSKVKVPPPSSTKPKPVKSRRQSAPASKMRRVAPPPPMASSPHQKAPPTTELSPDVPRTSNSPKEPVKSIGDDKKSEETPKSGEVTEVKKKSAVDVNVKSEEGKEETGKTEGRPVSPTAANAPPIPKPPATRPGAPKKRRTTAVDNRTKPRRRPPPPSPQILLEAASAASAANTAQKPAEVSATPPKEPETATAAKPAPLTKIQEVETPVGTPIPPPRVKARMKRVKRPTSRTIPPPPNIPLPPPPAKKKASPLMTSVRAHDTSRNTDTHPLHSGVKAASEGGAGTPLGTPKGSRPPLPKRISSLAPPSPLVAKSKPPIEPTVEEKQEVKPSVTQKAPSRQDSAKQLPPKRPPPPRPTNSPVDQSATVDNKKPEKPSRPPSMTKKSSEAEITGGGIQPRGSKLMGSLKRLVKRDSSKNSAKADKPEEVVPSAKEPLQRPAHPPRKSKKAAPPAEAENTGSPVPAPRKKKSSATGPPPKEIAPSPSNPPQSLSPQLSEAGSSSQPTQNLPARPSLPPTQQQPVAASRQQQPTVSKPEEESSSSPTPKPSTSTESSTVSESKGQSTQSERRKSSNIPAKPKPPLAPKPSISSISKPGSSTPTTPTTPTSKTGASENEMTSL